MSSKDIRAAFKAGANKVGNKTEQKEKVPSFSAMSTPVQSLAKKTKCNFSPPSPDMDEAVCSKIDSMIDEKLKCWDEQMDTLSQKVIQNTNTKVDEMQELFTRNLNHTLKEIKMEIKNSKGEIMSGVKDILHDYEVKLCSQSEQIDNLEHKLKIESEKRMALEAQLKQNNIKVFGIPQNTADVEKFILSTFQDVAPDLTVRDIDDIHTVNTQGSKSVPVIVKFCSNRLKKVLLQKKDDLKEKGITITNDVPLDWQKKRRILWPFVEKAKTLKNMKGENIKAFIVRDRMMIDKKQYTVETLDELPPPLTPPLVYTPSKDDVTLFFSKFSPFSNHYPCAFKVNDVNYNSSEQYIMQQKSLLFDDENQAVKIMSVQDPVEQKVMGSNLKRFNAKKWEAHAEKIAYEGVKAKVLQNPDIQEILIATGTNKIAEANGNDTLFSIGYFMNEPKAWDTKEWAKGKNIMGNVLERIRSELILGT